MKVGDLVELSQKGRDTLWCRRFRDMCGIIVEISLKRSPYDPNTSVNYYTVMFTGKKGTHSRGRIPRSYLKFV